MKFSFYLTLIILIYVNCPLGAGTSQGTVPVLTDTARAGQLMIWGEILQKQSQFDSAMTCFNQACEIYSYESKQNDNADLWEKYIRCIANTGLTCINQIRFEPAAEKLELALKLGREKLGENHVVLAFVYKNLATLHYRQGDLQKTLEYDLKSLNINVKNLGLLNPEVGKNFYNVGLTYQDIGDYDAALKCYTKSLEISQQLFKEEHSAVALAYGGIGQICRFKGHYDDALEALNKALDIRLKVFGETNPWVAENYDIIGIVYQNMWDLDKATEYMKKSVSIYSQCFGEHHPSVAYGYNNIGVCYQKKGDNASALKYFSMALEGKIHALGPNHPSVASTNANIGSVYLNQGDPEKALKHYNRSLAIWIDSKGKNHPSVAIEYTNIGQSYFQMTKYRQALEYFNKALALQVQITGNQHPRVAEICTDIGRVYLDKSEVRTALEFFQKAISAVVPGFEPPDIYTNPVLGSALSDQDLLNALHYKAVSFSMLEPRTLENLSASLQTFQLASDLIDNIRCGFKAEGSRLFLGEAVTEIYDRAIQTAIELRRITRNPMYQQIAFEFAEKSRIGSLAFALQESRARKFAGIPDRLLREEGSLRADLAYYNTMLQQELRKEAEGDSVKIESCENQLFDLNTRYQHLLTRLEAEYPDYYQLKYQTGTIPASGLMHLLDEETALLEYFTVDKSFVIFLVTHDRIDIFQRSLESPLYDPVLAFCRSIQKVDQAEFLRLNALLYDILIQPVRQEIMDKKKLVLVPQDILSKIPFEALAANASNAGSDGPDYLIKHFEISYHLSASLYAQNLRKSEAGPFRNVFAGFAPVFSHDTDNGGIAGSNVASHDLAVSDKDERAADPGSRIFTDLEHSEREIRDILGLFREKKMPAAGFFGRDASEQNLKMHGGSCRYLHIASHGIVNETYPQLSGILFSQLPDNDKTDDGILYAGEVYNLQLDADLVVLSSCESGIGKLVKGEGLIALSRGFLYAGARNLVVSLWKVSDKHTSGLMVNFYRHILENEDYAASLRMAKLAMIENPATAFPKSWGAFVLIGGN
ncbi:CHAT domain-containing protein [bacterium]|nr:CHAT domain-containing protein [bacterium]